MYDPRINYVFLALLLFAIMFLPSTYVVSIQIVFWGYNIVVVSKYRDTTDLLTSVIYIIATYGAGLAMAYFAAKREVLLPDVNITYMMLVLVMLACWLTLGAKKAMTLITVLCCVLALLSSCEINRLLQEDWSALYIALKAVSELMFAVFMRAMSLPFGDGGGGTPLKNKDKKQKRVWHPGLHNPA